MTSSDVFAATVSRSQWVMGTRLTVAVEPPRGRPIGPIFARAFEIVRRLDELLSNYRPRSALSRLNRQAGAAGQRVDPRLFRFVERALHYARATEGAFDITSGALVSLYRRGAVRRSQVEGALRVSGYTLVRLAAPDRIRFQRPGVSLDPGAIGKGYAVDAVVRFLRDNGVCRAFVDFGGSSFYGLGKPSGRDGWPVLLRAAEPGRSLGVVSLNNRALSFSMSGAGERDHSNSLIVDPRTGQRIEQRRVSVATSPSAAEAEVLSTALVVQPTLWPRIRDRFPGASCLTETAGSRRSTSTAFPAGT